MTDFHDPYLIGNGAWCSCCFPDGPPRGWFNQRWHRRRYRGCNECAGEGRIAFTAEKIVQATIAERRPVRSRTSGAPA